MWATLAVRCRLPRAFHGHGKEKVRFTLRGLEINRIAFPSAASAAVGCATRGTSSLPQPSVVAVVALWRGARCRAVMGPPHSLASARSHLARCNGSDRPIRSDTPRGSIRPSFGR